MRSFLLTALIWGMASFSFGAAPVTYTICPSGCSFVDFHAATGTATSIDTIRFDANYTNCPCTISGNNAATITALNKNIMVSSASGTTVFAVTSGMNQPMNFLGFSITCTGTGSRNFAWTGYGASSAITMTDMNIYEGGTVNGISLGTNTRPYYAIRLSVFSSSGFGIFSSSITTNAVNLYGCLIYGATTTGIQITGNTANNVANIYNTNFINNTNAITAIGGFTCTNDLFSGNFRDVTITGTGGASIVGLGSLTYSGSTNSVAGWGTGSVSMTEANMFCNPNTYQLGPGSLARNAGVSINGITGTLDAMNGVRFGLDMGCYPYSLALCPGLGYGQ